MSTMLGQALIKLGAISEQDLEEALQTQLIHGGTLGTCLIEKGCIDERQLGEMLSTILGVPYAEASHFRNIPAGVLKTLSHESVEKHRIIPFRLDGRTLHVAMISPNNLLTLDELQFATGMSIEAWVVPEVRIVLALEKYYGIQRSLRFILLSPDPGDLGPYTDQEPSVAEASEAATARRVPNSPSPELVIPEPSNSYQEEPLQELAASIDTLNDRMCAASDMRELSACVLDCVSTGLERCILFRVKQDLVARIWDWRGFDARQEKAPEVALNVVREPLFRLISEDGAYMGRPEDLSWQEGLYRELEVDVPACVLLVPIYSHDRLVAMLYGDGGPDADIRGELSDYRRVARKIGPALERQMLEQRLRRI